MKLASIERIHSFRVHTNADSLECAKVKEWPVVVRKGEFKDGDLVVFVVIDSVLPDKPIFEFMRKQKFRVWNARFRGEPSSGLVQPLSILPAEVVSTVKEGDDVTELLGVTKYERPLDVSIGGKQAGHFPTNVISITDEDNALSYPEAFDELPQGTKLYITLKNDGSSVTIINSVDGFKACSRRFEMQEGEGFPWTIVGKYDLKNKLQGNVAIQGEAIGPKLNGNRLKLKEIEFRLFRAKNLDTDKLFDYESLKQLAVQLNVPIVEELCVIDYDKTVHTIEWFRNLADSVKWPNTGEPAEGIVIAPCVPFYSYTLRKMWSIKIINQSYKQE